MKGLKKQIARDLEDAGFKTDSDRFEDRSANWVAVMRNNYTITICFDKKGERIIDIELHKDIYDVVDTKKLI